MVDSHAQRIRPKGLCPMQISKFIMHAREINIIRFKYIFGLYKISEFRFWSL